MLISNPHLAHPTAVGDAPVDASGGADAALQDGPPSGGGYPPAREVRTQNAAAGKRKAHSTAPGREGGGRATKTRTSCDDTPSTSAASNTAKHGTPAKSCQRAPQEAQADESNIASIASNKGGNSESTPHSSNGGPRKKPVSYHSSKTVLTLLEEKDSFLMLIRVLMKLLEQHDMNMHDRAKAVIKECHDKNKAGDPQFLNLAASTTVPLRAMVGEHHWQRAQNCLAYFLEKKRQACPQGQRQEGGGAAAAGGGGGAEGGTEAAGSAATMSEEKKEKRGRFLMFGRGLMKHLEQHDLDMHGRAKAVIMECHEKNKAGDPHFADVEASITIRLRAIVSERHWQAAHDYLDRYLEWKRQSRTEHRRGGEGATWLEAEEGPTEAAGGPGPPGLRPPPSAAEKSDAQSERAARQEKTSVQRATLAKQRRATKKETGPAETNAEPGAILIDISQLFS